MDKEACGKHGILYKIAEPLYKAGILCKDIVGRETKKFVKEVPDHTDEQAVAAMIAYSYHNAGETPPKGIMTIISEKYTEWKINGAIAAPTLGSEGQSIANNIDYCMLVDWLDSLPPEKLSSKALDAMAKNAVDWKLIEKPKKSI